MLSARPYLQQIELTGDTDPERGYPFDIPAVRHLGTLAFHPDVTFLVGENGAGKSTVLEAIALALGFSPEGGTRNARVRTTESTSRLHEHLRLARSFKHPADGYFLRAESFFNVATYMNGIGVGADLHACSHGEAFLSLLTGKFRGKGLYLLDEPEAALSPSRQLAALSAMHQLVQDDSQFIIATHSPILLAYPGAKIVLFDGSGVTEIAYEDTEHYTVTRDFLNHHQDRVARLLAED